MRIFQLPLRRLLKRIETANEAEIQRILWEIILWQKHNFPEEELLVISIPKNDLAKRKLYLKMMLDMLTNTYLTKEAWEKSLQFARKKKI